MEVEPESSFDQLWKDYSVVFREFDDLMLARWMAQTLRQIEGRVWRLSHPLLGAYRLAAQVAHERQTWLKRLVTPPPGFGESSCCRAPRLPLLTREVMESGLVCQHCNETLAPLEELPEKIQAGLRLWAVEYGAVHAVAHWDDQKRKASGNYDRAYESAAQRAEGLLARVGGKLAPELLELYSAVIWEDQDECLEVRPEDVAV